MRELFPHACLFKYICSRVKLWRKFFVFSKMIIKYNSYRFREKLIQELPPMAPAASLEDLSSVEECGTLPLLIEDASQEEYALDLDAPPIFNTLKNVTKSRSRRSARRPPSRQHRRSMFEKHFPVKFS